MVIGRHRPRGRGEQRAGGGLVCPHAREVAQLMEGALALVFPNLPITRARVLVRKYKTP